MIEVLSKDQVFTMSPDAGHPTCICSRCGAQIKEDECPTRIWTTNNQGKVDGDSVEYRYCEACMRAAGIVVSLPSMSWEDDPFDPVPEHTCRQCGCSHMDACQHLEHGNCWWGESDLCSHCHFWPGESKRYSEKKGDK